MTSLRLRDGTVVNLGYDKLNRVTTWDRPGGEPDVTYTYDTLSRVKTAAKGGQTLTNNYDALSRVTSTSGILGTNSYSYDAAGRRTSFTYPGSGLTINYDYDAAGNVTAIRENGATSGTGVLATYAYDHRGRRTSVTYGNGTVESSSYDSTSSLASFSQNMPGTTQDVTTSFTYNPAGQIKSRSQDNDAYAWNGHYNADKAEVPNGLNQLVSQGSTSLSYDGRGNLTSLGSSTYTYTSENLMNSAPGGVWLSYDPTMRLFEVGNGTGITRFAYDGQDMIAEYNGAGTLQRRYVHGPGVDEPIVQYEGSGTSDKRWMHRDERGSIVAITNASGTVTNINSYDDYGVPAPTNTGRFQYTGQTWIPEVGLYYYKARFYSASLGRFMQSDPIGYGDGMNVYAYVGGDPINFVDPTGLWIECRKIDQTHEDKDGVLVVTWKVDCYENGKSLGPIDLAVIQFRNQNIGLYGYEIMFSVGPNIFEVKPNKQKSCNVGGEVIDSTFASIDAFGSGSPSHLHNPASPSESRQNSPGRDDGIAARNGVTGKAYVGTPTGVFIVTRYGSDDYSIGLLSGTWGASDTYIKNLVTNWNKNDGQYGKKPAHKSTKNCKISNIP